MGYINSSALWESAFTPCDSNLTWHGSSLTLRESALSAALYHVGAAWWAMRVAWRHVSDTLASWEYCNTSRQKNLKPCSSLAPHASKHIDATLEQIGAMWQHNNISYEQLDTSEGQRCDSRFSLHESSNMTEDWHFIRTAMWQQIDTS